MNTRNDRTVHCTVIPIDGGRIEIVRYDRSGKWYREEGDRRRPLTLGQAVLYAEVDRPAVIWHEGRPGGRAFDAMVRRARLIAAERQAGS
ncbi:hypothetical protein [Microbacterium sp. 1P06AB]|uniref:hypothetical protein n=1 Tax=Microbacterium sp. 1P06AB TaxID=3132289 RepID=UPI0039A6AA97